MQHINNILLVLIGFKTIAYYRNVFVKAPFFSKASIIGISKADEVSKWIPFFKASSTICLKVRALGTIAIFIIATVIILDDSLFETTT
jgi:hypothetical protein